MRAVAACLILAALSLALVAPAPSYDPWAWLLWGRELVGGELNTAQGPAFKPLPVAVAAVLAPSGSAAPWLWVLLARTAALLAVWLAFRLGRRLSGGSVAAGGLAAVAVALCGGYLSYAASGLSEPLLLALVMACAESWRAGRPRVAIACGIGCALLRVETWPFLLAAGLVLWRRRPQDRPLLAASAVAVPALWLVPELIGSGELLRSGERALVPNPGAPALAGVPALAAAREAVRQPLWPLWLGLAGLALLAWRERGRATVPALVPALAGLTWIALVGLMAEAGFSGEARYSSTGAALIALSGAVGLAALARRAPRPALAFGAMAAITAAVALPRLGDLPKLRAAQAYQWELATDLADAVEVAGGRARVRACGQTYVGPLRGPLMAYRLDVRKHEVEPDRPPSPPGVVFQSGSAPPVALGPGADGFAEIARAGHWRVLAACGS